MVCDDDKVGFEDKSILDKNHYQPDSKSAHKTGFYSCKNGFPRTIYWIWREKNGRRHLGLPNSVQLLAHTIRSDIHSRLFAMCHDNDGDGAEATYC